MSAITFDYNENHIQELCADETDYVTGGFPALLLTALKVAAVIGGIGLVIFVVVAVAAYVYYS